MATLHIASVQSGITAQNKCSETFFLRSHTSASRSGNAGSFTDWYLLCPRSVGISKGKLRKIILPENSNESPKRDGTRRGLKQIFCKCVLELRLALASTNTFREWNKAMLGMHYRLLIIGNKHERYKNVGD